MPGPTIVTVHYFGRELIELYNLSCRRVKSEHFVTETVSVPHFSVARYVYKPCARPWRYEGYQDYSHSRRIGFYLIVPIDEFLSLLLKFGKPIETNSMSANPRIALTV